MPDLSTAELVLVHLDATENLEEATATYERSIPGIVEALDVGDTVAGRVELVTSLRELGDRGLAEMGREPLPGSTADRPTYRLTADGRETVASCLREVGDEQVVVERADERETVAVEDLSEAVPELSLGRALADVTEHGILRLHDGDGFVGRWAAMETLRSAIADVEAGESRTVVVAGERGIGKTELVETALERADGDAFQQYVGAARETMTEPYAAFRDALEPHRDVAPSRLFEGSESVDGANLEQRRRSFFHEVAEFLRELSESGPVAFFLNDLERADPATVALFEFLSDVLDDDRVLLVAARTPEAGSDDDQHAERDRSGLADATRVELEGFDVASTRRFLEQRLDDTGLPERFVDALQELTGGNPLFLEASLSYMRENGIIDPRTSYYPTDAADLPVPGRIESVILERIDGLDPGTESVLEYGSVVGETMQRSVLEAVVDVDADRVDVAVDRLVDAGFWKRDGEGRLKFASDVVREVVYDGVGADKRTRSHERVAEAIQDVYAAALDSHAAEVAGHYRDAGAVDDAIEWYERAGTHAASVYAYETAVEAYEQALDLARDADREDVVLDRMVDIGRVHMQSDDYDEAQRYFEYVEERTDDPTRLRSIAADQAKMHVDRGKYAAAVETVDGALETWDGESTSAVLCKLLVRKVRAVGAMGDVDEARALGERAQSMTAALDSAALRALVLKARGATEHQDSNYERAAELGTRAVDAATEADAERLLAGIYNNVAGSRSEMGKFRGAMHAFERSRDRWQAIGNRVGEAVPLGNIGYAQVRLGRFDAARENIERSMALGERLGMDGHLVFQCRFLSQLYINEGDIPLAREYVERSLDLAEETNQERSVSIARNLLSRVCRLEDDHETALEHAERVIERSADTESEMVSNARLHAAQTRREQGDVEGAMQMHREALADTSENSHWKPPVVHRIGLAMACVEANRAAEAVELAERASTDAGDAGNVLFRFAARTALAKARHATGDSDTAEAEVRDVIADCVDVGSRTYECQARVALGSMLADRGATAEACETLETAVDIGREAGVELYVRKAYELLADVE